MTDSDAAPEVSGSRRTEAGSRRGGDTIPGDNVRGDTFRSDTFRGDTVRSDPAPSDASPAASIPRDRSGIHLESTAAPPRRTLADAKLGIVSRLAPSRRRSGPTIRERIGKRIVLSLLSRLTIGTLEVVDENGASHTFGTGSVSPAGESHRAILQIHDPACYPRIAFGGSVGAAKAFIDGLWSAPDLTAAQRLFLANLDVFAAMNRGFAMFTEPFRRLLQWSRRNTRRGSRDNIHVHYDLGNAFYASFLDETMTYSSAFFETAAVSLEDAQRAKYERIARRLDLSASDHVLEIGTGWGGLAIHIAENHGCRVTTTTISREQYEFAKDRIAERGLEDRITLLLEDYRDVTGTYDKIVSIEMIEAVGHQFYRTFFRTLRDRLVPTGVALIQAITLRDDRYEIGIRQPDFIQQYVFPGSDIPSVTALGSAATAASDLRLVHQEDFGPHYAETLRRWRERFTANLPAVRELGFPPAFERLWNYYLSYCEAGFDERHVGVSHLLYARPHARFPTPAGAGVDPADVPSDRDEARPR